MSDKTFYCETKRQTYTIHARSIEDAMRYLIGQVSLAELAEMDGWLEVREVPAKGIRFKVEGNGRFSA